VNADRIPGELRELTRWVNWRWGELDPNTGKRKKPPYQPANPAVYASSTNEATWGTFEEALAVVDAGKADGIGFSLLAPYVLVDLDAELSRSDRGAIAFTLDSYTETSVSGTGWHVILRANLSGHGRHPEGLGVFQVDRFCYFSGSHLVGTPTTIEWRQAQLEMVLDAFMPGPAPAPPSAAPAVPVDLDDLELLERAFGARNPEEFRMLYDGAWQGRYGSQSEGDLALCGMLAFWTGRNAARVDRLFRASGLMRPKWDARRGESSYGSQTIERAIASTTEAYATSPLTSPEEPQESPPWVPIDLVKEAAKQPEPPEILGLFYPGYNHVLSGESEALKTWLLLAAAVTELARRRGVIWIDGDDVGGGALLERLQMLGAEDEAISQLFAYYRADHPINDYIPAVLEDAAERKCRLAVLDGFNPLLLLHGLDPNAGVDVERLYLLFDPLRKAGTALVLTDNVVKSKETRGGWAIGSERKRSKAEVHLGMRALQKLVRGGTGKAKIDVHKDRPGHLQRPSPGLFVVETGGAVCTWRIDPDDSRGEEGAFRPTALMAKVSWFLQQRQDEPQPLGQIEKAKLGKTDFVRQAVECLIAEGYVTEERGARAARLMRFERPFAEEES
jgi:hypothetical protein